MSGDTTMAHIEDLPKISLHDHLDGGLRPETIIDIAKRENIDLPADTPDELADWFVDSCTGGSLEEYLQTFELTISVMQYPEDLRRVATEYVLDLWDDGVIYGEVRWAPEQHTRRGLTMDAAVQAVQIGIDEAVAEILRTDDIEIGVGQVLCAMRQSERSFEVAELALKYRDTGVVGFDLAGPEAGYPPANHRPALELLAANHFPVTIHAGEADGIESINDALLAGRALRLGHGTKLANDLDLTVAEDGTRYVEMGRTAQWIRDREIALECCPTSNVQTGAFVELGTDIEDHPFDLFYRLGMRVTVNTDNRLMSDTTLSQELELLADTFDYTLDDLREFQVNAALAAFLPLEDRLDLVSIIDAGFDVFEEDEDDPERDDEQ